MSEFTKTWDEIDKAIRRLEGLDRIDDFFKGMTGDTFTIRIDNEEEFHQVMRHLEAISDKFKIKIEWLAGGRTDEYNPYHIFMNWRGFVLGIRRVENEAALFFAADFDRSNDPRINMIWREK